MNFLFFYLFVFGSLISAVMLQSEADLAEEFYGWMVNTSKNLSIPENVTSINAENVSKYYVSLIGLAARQIYVRKNASKLFRNFVTGASSSNDFTTESGLFKMDELRAKYLYEPRGRTVIRHLCHSFLQQPSLDDFHTLKTSTLTDIVCDTPAADVKCKLLNTNKNNMCVGHLMSYMSIYYRIYLGSHLLTDADWNWFLKVFLLAERSFRNSRDTWNSERHYSTLEYMNLFVHRRFCHLFRLQKNQAAMMEVMDAHAALDSKIDKFVFPILLVLGTLANGLLCVSTWRIFWHSIGRKKNKSVRTEEHHAPRDIFSTTLTTMTYNSLSVYNISTPDNSPSTIQHSIPSSGDQILTESQSSSARIFLELFVLALLDIVIIMAMTIWPSLLSWNLVERLENQHVYVQKLFCPGQEYLINLLRGISAWAVVSLSEKSTFGKECCGRLSNNKVAILIQRSVKYLLLIVVVSGVLVPILLTDKYFIVDGFYGTCFRRTIGKFLPEYQLTYYALIITIAPFIMNLVKNFILFHKKISESNDHAAMNRPTKKSNKQVTNIIIVQCLRFILFSAPSLISFVLQAFHPWMYSFVNYFSDEKRVFIEFYFPELARVCLMLNHVSGLPMVWFASDELRKDLRKRFHIGCKVVT